MSLSLARPMDSDVLQDGEDLRPPVGFVEDLKHGVAGIIDRARRARPARSGFEDEADPHASCATRRAPVPCAPDVYVHRRTASAAASERPSGSPRTTSTSVTFPLASIETSSSTVPSMPGAARRGPDTTGSTRVSTTGGFDEARARLSGAAAAARPGLAGTGVVGAAPRRPVGRSSSGGGSAVEVDDREVLQRPDLLRSDRRARAGRAARGRPAAELDEGHAPLRVREGEVRVVDGVDRDHGSLRERAPRAAPADRARASTSASSPTTP